MQQQESRQMIFPRRCLITFGELFQEFEGGEEASLASFFRHLSVGGVARPVDTLLMAGLILYGSRPFEKAVQSKTKQLAYVFQVHLLGNSQQPCQNPRRLFLWHSATRRNQSPAELSLHWCYQTVSTAAVSWHVL